MPEIRELKCLPLTWERWKDFEELFGKHGACGGCWCMWWRLTRSEFMKCRGAGNKEAMKQIIASGRVPGILAYAEGKPVGWCSVAPRKDFIALGRSRILKPVDNEPVWSIVCFYVVRQFRHKGLTTGLLKAALEHAGKYQGKIVEGYPVETERNQPDPFVYTGLSSTFKKVGFKEVARRSKNRPIMRRVLAEI